MQSTTDSKIKAKQMGVGQPKARRGVSLIEVLVVLVILVTGILVIIRLYPSGFFSVQSVGNAAVADSLGKAALEAAQQNLGSLPEVIQPGGKNPLFLGGMDTYGRPLATALDGSYDPDFNASQEPDYSVILNKARLIVNENITVPTASAGSRQSVYVTKFGPIVTQEPKNAPQPYTPIPDATFLSVNSTNWQPVAGDSMSPVPPQDSAPVNTQQFVVDLARRMIAVPYAAYTAPGINPPTSYAQKIVVYILGSNGVTYPQYLNVPPAMPRDTMNPYAPYISTTPPGSFGVALAYLADTANNYQGGWFDPTMAYGDMGAGVHSTVPPAVNWVSVSLFRPFSGIDPTVPFSTNNPYEFKLISPDLPYTGPAQPQPHYNLGGIAFNPIAGGGVGYNALKAQISYRVASWQVIHEDRDVPALPSGNTSVLRLSLKNLKRAGDEGPNNSIDPGLLSSGHSVYILDLDTGKQVAPGDPLSPGYDPTITDFPVVDEDVDGTKTGDNLVNISYAIGRVTFGSNVFGDNSTGTTPHVHRVRIFYTGDLNWTVAVQKAPAYYVVDAPITGNSADILPGHCAYSVLSKNLLFPQMDSAKTVEIDGPSDLPNQTGVVSDIVDSNVTSTVNGQPIKYVGFSFEANQSAQFSPAQIAQITAVRGLSARAVVAWQERGQWKSHSVDTILNRQ